MAQKGTKAGDTLDFILGQSIYEPVHIPLYY